ncbi:xylan glycosyltransferase MUCI21-like [Henckelia pumila]|uniref:xylan glycosyltransferase MUCI21-like n=1 Tax=Henckelia pumila TaxID=405737 RepID=UPI003C6E4833
MVKYPRNNQFNQWKRSREHVAGEDDESCLHPSGLICGNSSCSTRKAKLKLLFFILLSLIYGGLILAPQFLSSGSSFSFFYPYETDVKASLCSSVPNGTICCDRTSIRTDVCLMRGDVRTDSTSSSIVLYRENDVTGYLSGFSNGYHEEGKVIEHQKIRPYTRKWETDLMSTVDELDLIVKWDSGILRHQCEIKHDVPAVFFSTGGYTGNLYHEFNDGILPLYITSQHFNKKVVFVILEYHDWWVTKYGDILSQLSDFPAVDFRGDKRVHCFPEAILGLRIHDELSIDASLMEGNKSMGDFHELLDRAYWPRVRDIMLDEERDAESSSKNPIQVVAEETQISYKPKVVIVSRNGSRAITNEHLLVKMAEQMGFVVEVLRPQRTTELAKIYRVLNSSDVMIGVHGAAMTHFLFMKPGSVFIQVIPLGTDWAAETYYGEPAVKFGLSYIGYKILPKESSLYHHYPKNDPVLTDPSSVNEKGWEFTKKIYLDRQTVKLDLRRFRKRLLRAYYYTVAKKKSRSRIGAQ